MWRSRHVSKLALDPQQTALDHHCTAKFTSGEQAVKHSCERWTTYYGDTEASWCSHWLCIIDVRCWKFHSWVRVTRHDDELASLLTDYFKRRVKALNRHQVSYPLLPKLDPCENLSLTAWAERQSHYYANKSHIMHIIHCQHSMYMPCIIWPSK